MSLGDRGAEHTGLGERRPGLGVDPIIVGRELSQALVGRLVTEDLGSQVV